MKKVLGVFILSVLTIGCGDMANQKISTEVRFENIDGLELTGLGRKLEIVGLVHGKLTLSPHELTLSSLDELKQYRFPILDKSFASYDPAQLSEMTKKITLRSYDTGQPVDLELNVSAKLVSENTTNSVNDCIVYDFVYGSDYPLKKSGTQEVQIVSKNFEISLSGAFKDSDTCRGNFDTIKANTINIVNEIPLSKCIAKPARQENML